MQLERFEDGNGKFEQTKFRPQALTEPQQKRLTFHSRFASMSFTVLLSKCELKYSNIFKVQQILLYLLAARLNSTAVRHGITSHSCC